MKKKKNREEIVSLNDELLSFDSGDISLEALERRLELAVAPFICGTFVCSSFSKCSSFGCGTFGVGTN